MSNYIRPKVPGATVFCTVVLAQRGSALLVDYIDLLREAVAETKSNRPFQFDAWVVLPDHMHFVLTLPEGDSDLGARIGAMKARFTRKVKAMGRVGFHHTIGPGKVGYNPTLRRSQSKVRKGDGGIWQRRFWEHHIRNEDAFRAYVEYCHINPVKHGFVDRPEEWPYSTVHQRGM
ncbi:REP-associated tyrosine transposase [Cognatishimia activa]|uniref:REP-associated tyrosine transposase n=1 Tax=Cognatishimia activa TaxID=1715691 RepID=UPI002231E386|nr:transposase [Cognatishimia activa]UZD90023.1 transposase [Cognatishimia activa]